VPYDQAAIIAGILDPDQPIAAEQADCTEFVGQSARIAGQIRRLELENREIVLEVYTGFGCNFAARSDTRPRSGP
jgi:hypothetical protein